MSVCDNVEYTRWTLLVKIWFLSIRIERIVVFNVCGFQSKDVRGICLDVKDFDSNIIKCMQSSVCTQHYSYELCESFYSFWLLDDTQLKGVWRDRIVWPIYWVLHASFVPRFSTWKLLDENNRSYAYIMCIYVV